jgi:hypothetical protein
MAQIKRTHLLFVASLGFGPRALAAEGHSVEDSGAKADPHDRKSAIIDKNAPIREEDTRTGSQKDIFLFSTRED